MGSSSSSDLRAGAEIEGLQALAHWCWYVCDQAGLPVGIAATNYAVEGATGVWSCVVCSKTTGRTASRSCLPDLTRADAALVT